MGIARVISLFISTFGVYVFGALVLQMFRPHAQRGCSGSSQATTSREFVWVRGAVLVTCFLWFVVTLGMTLVSLNPEFKSWPLQTVQLVLSYLFPPLIMHIVSPECQCSTRRLEHRGWRLAVWVMYAASLGFCSTSLLAIFNVIDLPFRLGLMISVSIGGLFTLTAIYSVLVISSTKGKTESRAQRSSRRSMVGMFSFMAVVCLLLILSSLDQLRFDDALMLVTRSLPLMFMFVGTYHDDRFVFFDLFIKRGLFLLLTIFLLASFFGLVRTPLEGLGMDWALPWVYTVLLLPIALSMPWLYRKLAHLVDSFWLGRRFSTVEAVKYFLAGLHSATNEVELAERAEQGLSTIFHAPARVDLRLSGSPALDFDSVQDVSILAGEQHVGVILMGRRTNHAPYFSEDIALLRSLTDVFSYMLENTRLQQKKQEQERRTKELSLQASRSELKALRAQINPHFLFNALNAIAGLIHKDPALADNTVEQLAEVFRYTLRGSENEWALLEDEMEFVEAYLQVEQARFGSRLEVSIDVDPKIKRIQVPTMMIQTLVENAIKHGVSSVRGTARIEIDARCEADRLRVEVTDNGSGFLESTTAFSPPEKNGGYGLRNIQKRLEGHFEDRAELTIRRDEQRGMTVVSLDLPLTLDVPGKGSAGSHEVA